MNNPKVRIKKGQIFTENSGKEKTIFTLQIVATFVIVALLVWGGISLFSELTKNNRQEVSDSLVTGQSNQAQTYTRPDRVVINKAGVDSVIEQPNSRDVDTLDQALQSGAVHYPGSGSIEEGNIFLFGHSSNWKIVQNQAYKTFNGIENLVSGDSISLWANGKEYVYRVRSVDLVDENEALVDLSQKDRILTISTCNSFGAKQERFVVKADFVKIK